eukprot:comp68622_c0_seq1/m.48078 comp68622_c0_seq1/g.48078  ORF comp68622_c0_seq1/g.48078 comp68622_c0_seq1/m.48078 type:complete len:165 (-) comp68622_c0_seq1:3-497(-)
MYSEGLPRLIVPFEGVTRKADTDWWPALWTPHTGECTGTVVAGRYARHKTNKTQIEMGQTAPRVYPIYMVEDGECVLKPSQAVGPDTNQDWLEDPYGVAELSKFLRALPTDAWAGPLLSFKGSLSAGSKRGSVRTNMASVLPALSLKYSLVSLLRAPGILPGIW